MLAADSNKKFDGILVAPGNPALTESMLRRFACNGVPVVCVADDSPRSGRLASVTTDAYTSGAIAAELFARVIPDGSELATFTGTMAILNHAEKIRGFRDGLAALAPGLSLLPIMETHGKPGKAFLMAKKLLMRLPYPRGIYVGTANGIPILRALEERRLIGKVHVITTDIFPELVPYIQSGNVLASLYQRPFTQGKAALHLLVEFLINGAMPKTVTRFAPHIVLRSNLALFTHHDACNCDWAGEVSPEEAPATG